MGLLDGRTLWFNRDHLFHDCCDHDLPKIFTTPTHCDLSNITYILLYSGSFQKKNIKNKSASRLWPRHRSLPIHSGKYLESKRFFRKLYYRAKWIRIFKYLKQKSNYYFYWFTMKHSSMSKGLYFDLNAWPTIPILNGIYYVFEMN